MWDEFYRKNDCFHVPRIGRFHSTKKPFEKLLRWAVVLLVAIVTVRTSLTSSPVSAVECPVVLLLLDK